jgi:hypothetical protein
LIKKQVLFFGFLFLVFAIHAQNKSKPINACSDSNHQQFDFWVGQWAVYDVKGNKIGTNHIEKIENGCVLQEHWIGSKGITGTSINYFDKTDKKWHQLWVDSSGNKLILSGGYQDGKMTMDSDWIQGKKGLYKNRIAWILQKNKSVIQVWDIVGKDGTVIQEAFRGIYKK